MREDERNHLARELRDELGGLLTTAKLDLARMRSRLEHAGPEVAERVAHLHATLDAGIALKRRIIEDLRPSSLDNLGLEQALRILCREWTEAIGIPVHLELEEASLGAERSLVVYRLVQEALTNIAKYAHATQVTVTLGTEADSAFAERSQGDRNGPNAGGNESRSQSKKQQALVEVRDNGRGFIATKRAHGHGNGHGLAGMRFRGFRVGSVGGELMVESAPGKGTHIRARLPKED